MEYARTLRSVRLDAGLLERVITALLLAAVAAPFWAGRFLPFLDLPQHLALSSVIARYGDRSTGFATYYHVDWHIAPYWGFYTLMHLLIALKFDPLTASRLLFTAYGVGLPLSAGYLLKGLDRDWRWAAFTLPLVYNTNLFFGFANFVLSLPIFFLALGLAVRTFAAAKPSERDEWRLAAAASLVYLFHVQSYLLLGVCVVTLFAIHWQGLGWALRRAAPFSLSLLLFLSWLFRSFLSGPRHDGEAAGLGAVYESLGDVLSKVPERLLGTYNDGSDYTIAAALLLLFLAALAVAGGRQVSTRFRGGLVERRGEVLSVLLFATYLFAPFEIGGQWYVNPRHLVLAAVLAPAFLAAPVTGFRRSIVALACLLGVWASLKAAEKVRAFQDQVGPFDLVLEQMEPGKRVMNLMFNFGENGPVRYWPFEHWSCYYQAEKGGDSSSSFAGLPAESIAAHAVPVTYRKGRQPPIHSNNPRNFRWDELGMIYDYFLIRGRPEGEATQLGEHALLVIQAGEWQLWRRRGALTQSDLR